MLVALVLSLLLIPLTNRLIDGEAVISLYAWHIGATVVFWSLYLFTQKGE
jgi:hypothetical protein